jgi:HEAT repeat protein
VGALVVLLAGPDPGLGEDAFAALGELGPLAAAAIPSLTRLFEDEGASTALRGRAAKALGTIGHAAQSSVPALARALSAPDQALRDSAAGALVQMGSAACVASEAVANLAKLSMPGPPANARGVLRSNPYLAGCASGSLGSMLEDPSPQLRKSAVEILSTAGEGAWPAVPGLAGLLERGTDPPIPILTAIGRIGPGSLAASPQLAARLEDPDPEVRRAIVEAVDKMGVVDARLGRSLLRLAGAAAQPEDIRMRAIWVLGQRRVPEALPLLMALLKDARPAIACSAVSSLAYYGPAARPALDRVEAIRRDGKLCYDEAVQASIDAIRDE